MRNLSRALLFPGVILLALVTLLVVLVSAGGPTEPRVVPGAVVPLAASQTAGDVTYGPDGSARLDDSPRVSAGVCRTFTGTIVVEACVPLYSPEGGVLVGHVQEDSSARYSDGWVISADDGWYLNDGIRNCYALPTADDRFTIVSDYTPDGLC